MVEPPTTPPGLRPLVLSSFASGFAALSLELLWGRQLALTLGGSHYAVATVLTAFMLGLGLGAAVGGRLADRLRRPAAVVAGIELSLALAAPLLSLALLRLPALAAALLPAATDSTGAAFLGGRFVLSVAVLLVPTALMGAGFPMLARAAALTVAQLHHGIGRLYAAATLGGVAGAVAAGFWLLPRFGLPGAVAAAGAANLVAAAAAAWGQRLLGRRPPTAAKPAADDRSETAYMLMAAAGISGALVLAAETIWHRALMLVLANSTATLSLLLAITLGGLGVGAALASPLLRRPDPLRRWASLQLLAAALLAVQAIALPMLATIARTVRPEAGWGRVLVPPLVVGGSLMVPVTLVLGAAWPLLLAAATPRLVDGGRQIGRLGIVNSVGAAAGAAAAGFLLLPAIGFGRTMVVLAAGHAALVVMAVPKPSGPRQRPIRAVALVLGVAALAVATAGPRFGRVPLPSLVGAADTKLLSYHESPAGTVVVTEKTATGTRAMFVDNNAVIGSTYDALKVVRMLGLVPAMLHPQPQRVLVIGYGAGVTTATVAATTGVESVEVVEIVPGVVEAARSFDRLNHDVIDDARVRIVTNDGRNHLLLNDTAFDLITCDPVHPLYGSAPLYSLDHFQLCRRRLRPGGIVCQYLPLHRMPEDAFRRAIATFQSAFDECWVLFGLGHAMLVGSDRPLVLDWDRWQKVLDEHPLADELATSALHEPAQIATLLLLDPDGCRELGRGPPSTDLHPRLEFLAPAAYRPDLWRDNARLLLEGYRSPLARIRGLPAIEQDRIRRLVAGKRLLLFSLLERTAGNADGAIGWIRQALQISPDDPELRLYARQLRQELAAR